MYTLNLKELKLKPVITEGKTFSGEDKEKISSDAVDYIKAQYKDVYNPFTIERMTLEMIRDEKGETQQERFIREDSESKNWFKVQIGADEKLNNEVWEKYRPEMKKNNEEEWNKIDEIHEEFENKMKDATGKTKLIELDEEMKLKIDDIKLEYQKREDEIKEKINKESKRDWVK